MKRILSLIVLTAVLFTIAIPAFAAERTTFEIEEKAYYDINVPFDVTIGIGTDYDKAEILVDDTVVASYEGGAAEEISEELSLDGKVNYLGNVKISAKVYYGEEVDLISKDILITKLGESINAFKEDFSAENSVYCGFIYNLSGNGPFQAHTFEDGNKAIKYVFDQSYKVDSQPFLTKDGMRIPAGSLITMQFDVYFSSNDCYMVFETRYYDETTKKNEYPKDGSGTRPSITLFTKADKTIGGNPVKAETWYTCKYEMDTITKGLKIYIKERDAAEFNLEYTYANYVSYGLNQIRPTFQCTSNTGAFTAVDNFTVDYIGQVPQWYAKHSFENAEGSAVSAGNVPIEGGKINLGFSKGMDITDGSILIKNEADDSISATSSYNETSFAYSASPVKLRYGSLYSVVFDENLKSIDGNSALTGTKISFLTAKYPVNISMATKTSDGVNIIVNNAGSAVDEKIAVCCYDANGAQLEYNLAAIEADGNMDVILQNAAAADKIVIYVLSAATGGEIYEIYTVE